jgi:prevent-host-death family protein
MRELTLDQAERDFAALIAAVEQGEDIVLTRDGRPVARIIRAPATPVARSHAEIAAIEAAAAQLSALRGRLPQIPFDWKEAVEEGRE